MSNEISTLRNEAEIARTLLANIRDVIDGDDEAAHDAIEGETSLIEAITAAVDRITELDAHEAAIAGMMKDLAARKERFAHQGEQIRAALCVAMGMVKLKKLELPQATLSLKSLPAKAVILSEVEIPSMFFVDQAPKLDKRSVLDALKSGAAVPGAVLSNGGETIAIRRS